MSDLIKNILEHEDKKLLESYEGDVVKMYKNKLWGNLNRRLDIFSRDMDYYMDVKSMDATTLLRKVDILGRDLEEIVDDWEEDFCHALNKLEDET